MNHLGFHRRRQKSAMDAAVKQRLALKEQEARLVAAHILANTERHAVVKGQRLPGKTLEEAKAIEALWLLAHPEKMGTPVKDIEVGEGGQ